MVIVHQSNVIHHNRMGLDGMLVNLVQLKQDWTFGFRITPDIGHPRPMSIQPKGNVGINVFDAIKQIRFAIGMKYLNLGIGTEFFLTIAVKYLGQFQCSDVHIAVVIVHE
jgi:hypothetical protein